MALQQRVDELMLKLSSVCENKVGVLAGLWEEMGIENLDNRIATVEEYIDSTFKKMIREEKGHLNDIIKTIETREKERRRLIKKLTRNSTDAVDFPQVSDKELEGLPLIQIANKLEEMNGTLNIIKEERMVEVRQLMKENSEVSAWVGIEALQMPEDTILIPSEIQQLKNHIVEMKDMRKRRMAQLEEMQIEISNMCETLQVEPESSTERNLLMDSAQNCVLSSQSMEVMKSFLDRLQRHFKNNQDKKDDMAERIKSLCSRLGYDSQTARKYLPTDDNICDSALKKVEASLEELEVLKKQHMSSFIVASRKEIEELWEKCYYGSTQKAEFLPYHSQNIDEETLNQLEQELDRLKKYHDHNARLFEKVDEWHNTWFHKMELEERAKDKTRLLGRGRNNLLEEEKERKAVQRRLPRIEKELLMLVDAHDEANPGKEFRIDGMRIVDFVREKKLEHNIEVKDEKSARKEVKKMMLKHETMYGINPLTPINQTSTALMKSRRDLQSSSVQKSMSMKRPGADTLPSAKRRRVNDGSILCGNLHQNVEQSVGSFASVDSLALYKEKDIVSSTFCKDSSQRHGRTLRTPHTTGRNMKTSTPSKSTTSLFKTPISASRSRLLRSTSKTANATTTTRTNLRGVKKVPFKL